MRQVNAVYENGRLTLPDGLAPEGRLNVVVTFPDLSPNPSEPVPARDKNAGKRFVREWMGVLEGCDVGNWKDEKAEYLKGKPHENPA